MKTLVLSSSALTKSCASSLSALGFEPIIMPPYHRLQEGVSSHPDMLVFFCGNKYICNDEYYEIAKDVFEKINALGYSPIITNDLPQSSYPQDVLFNSLKLGNKILGLTKAMSKALTSLAEENSIELINVNQGYTKCSVCAISDNAIITADQGIAAAAKFCGIDVLKITDGNVDLKGYNTGFIGGASGVFEDKVYFCGDIYRHPDTDNIIDFCAKHKKSCISLSNEALFDVGSLFFVKKL